MTPAARTQAAIELLDEIIAAARGGGAAADTLISRYFKARHYAGARDRRAIRSLVFRAIRRAGERPASGRAALLGLAAIVVAVWASPEAGAVLSAVTMVRLRERWPSVRWLPCTRRR